jgi:hypothetical protein
MKLQFKYKEQNIIVIFKPNSNIEYKLNIKNKYARNHVISFSQFKNLTDDNFVEKFLLYGKKIYDKYEEEINNKSKKIDNMLSPEEIRKKIDSYQ